MPWGRATAGTREMTSVCGEQTVHQTEQVFYTKAMRDLKNAVAHVTFLNSSLFGLLTWP